MSASRGRPLDNDGRLDGDGDDHGDQRNARQLHRDDITRLPPGALQIHQGSDQGRDTPAHKSATRTRTRARDRAERPAEQSTRRGNVENRQARLVGTTSPRGHQHLDQTGGRVPASTTGQADDRGKDNGNDNALKRLAV